MWELDPDWASYAGRHEYDSLMSIPGEEQRKAKIVRLKSFYDSLQGFAFAKLSIPNQIDYKLIGNYINTSLWYDQEFKNHEWNPAIYNVGGGFANIINGKYTGLDTRLKAVLHKLKHVPEYFEAAKANIKTPTIEHTDLAIAQNRGSLGVFGQSLIDSLDRSGLSQNEKFLFRQRLAEAKLAIEGYVIFLEEKRKSLNAENAKSFRIGKEHFAKKFALDMVSASTADDIYHRAMARKEELHKNMTKLADELWPKYMRDEPRPENNLVMIRQIIEKISRNHTHRDSFLVEIERQIPELVEFVNQKDLLTQDPSKPLIVRETPEYMAGVAGASISAPGPYDSGADTYYNVTPLTKYTDEQAESYLREYNDYVLQILNIHEAIPGHYTQLVYGNKAPSIVKSILRNGAMIEGWAVYSELMMLEEGYKNSPEMWLMYYKWNMRVTMNTILDYSIHVLGISREDGMNLLINEAFQEKSEATEKWKRATLSQVQLCSYFTGFSEIYALREELKQIKGNKFSLKEFHEEFLSYGNAPVAFIRDLMLGK